MLFSISTDKDGKETSSKSKANAGQLAVPRLSVCADAQKVDRAKLAQTEFTIIEFDPDTFRVLLDYLHTGSCPLTCTSIPGRHAITTLRQRFPHLTDSLLVPLPRRLNLCG